MSLSKYLVGACLALGCRPATTESVNLLRPICKRLRESLGPRGTAFGYFEPFFIGIEILQPKGVNLLGMGSTFNQSKVASDIFAALDDVDNRVEIFGTEPSAVDPNVVRGEFRSVHPPIVAVPRTPNTKLGVSCDGSAIRHRPGAELSWPATSPWAIDHLRLQNGLQVSLSLLEKLMLLLAISGKPEVHIIGIHELLTSYEDHSDCRDTTLLAVLLVRMESRDREISDFEKVVEDRKNERGLPLVAAGVDRREAIGQLRSWYWCKAFLCHGAEDTESNAFAGWRAA